MRDTIYGIKWRRGDTCKARERRDNEQREIKVSWDDTCKENTTVTTGGLINVNYEINRRRDLTPPHTHKQTHTQPQKRQKTQHVDSQPLWANTRVDSQPLWVNTRVGSQPLWVNVFSFFVLWLCACLCVCVCVYVCVFSRVFWLCVLSCVCVRMFFCLRPFSLTPLRTAFR